MVFPRAAQKLGRGDGLREKLRPVVVILQHADQQVQPRARNEDRADPVVELSAGQLVRVRAVGGDGLDLLAAHQFLIQGRIGAGQDERLAGIHPRFGGLDVAIEVVLGFGLQLGAQGRPGSQGEERTATRSRLTNPVFILSHPIHYRSETRRLLSCGCAMQKLIAVEEAKALMSEAIDWSLWGWLTEKTKIAGYRRQGLGSAGWGGREGEGRLERGSPEGLAANARRRQRSKRIRGRSASTKRRGKRPRTWIPR